MWFLLWFVIEVTTHEAGFSATRVKTAKFSPNCSLLYKLTIYSPHFKTPPVSRLWPLFLVLKWGEQTTFITFLNDHPLKLSPKTLPKPINIWLYIPIIWWKNIYFIHSSFIFKCSFLLSITELVRCHVLPKFRHFFKKIISKYVYARSNPSPHFKTPPF